MALRTFQCNLIDMIYRIIFYVLLASVNICAVYEINLLGIPTVFLWQFIWKHEQVRDEHPDTLTTMLAVEQVFEDPDTPDSVVTEGDIDLTPASSRNEMSVRIRRRKHYVGRVALLVKAEVGLLKLTAANKLVVQRLARDAMKEHGLRPTHIARLLPLVVAASFMRTDEDDLADSIISRLGDNAGPEER